MAKRRRLTREEREQRERAYQVWVRYGRATAATAAALGVEEKEVQRWERVHRWHERWLAESEAELARLHEANVDMEKLMPLISGVGATGQRLYVSGEMRAEAVGQAIDILFSVGGKTEEVARAAIRGMVPALVIGLAQAALGVDQDGKLMQKTDPEAQKMARDELIGHGLATQAELKTLTLPELSVLLRERLRERGYDPDPQA